MRHKEETSAQSSRGGGGRTSAAAKSRERQPPRDPSPTGGSRRRFDAEEIASDDDDRHTFARNVPDPVEEKKKAYAGKQGSEDGNKPPQGRDANPRRVYSARRALPDFEDDPVSTPGPRTAPGYGGATASRNTARGSSNNYYADNSDSRPGAHAVAGYDAASRSRDGGRRDRPTEHSYYPGEEQTRSTENAAVTPIAAEVVEDEVDIEARVNERVQKQSEEIERRIRNELAQSGTAGGASGAATTTSVASNQEEDDNDDDDDKLCGYNKWVVIIGSLVGLFIVVAVIAAAVVLSSGSGDDPTPTPAPTFTRSIPSGAPTKSGVCTLCVDGTVPNGLEENNVLAEEHAFEGEGDLTCAEFSTLMGSIDAADECAANQALAWELCSCPTLPPPVDNPSCSFCEGGAAFVGANAAGCEDLQTYTGLVNASYPSLVSSCAAERELAAGCECPEGVIGVEDGEARLAAFTEALVSVSGNLLEDTTTNQYRALNWLATQDEMMLPIDTTFEILSQRYIVALLFFETGGDESGGSWIEQLGFLSGETECNWNDGAVGLGCNDQGELIVIQINENGLIGRIPDEITFLPHITNLKLDVNSIGGTIPSAIGSLTRLGGLELARNKISGTIPDSLFTIPTLGRVWIENNTLTGEIPSTLSGATSLTSLALYTNSLEGPIPDISALTELDYIGLFTNKLTGTIPSFDTIPRIRNIWLYQNDFTGQTIPPSIGQLTQLSGLGLLECGLVGPVPSFSANNGHLESLYLNNNSLTGDIAAIVDDLLSIDYGVDDNTVGLEYLSLEANDFNGTIPTSVARFTALRQLFLGRSPLVNGTLPSELGLLSGTLESLDIEESNLTSTIPTELGLLTVLTELHLYDNALSGTLPSELGQLEMLQIMDLTELRLKGTIPDSFGALTNIFAFGLGFNQLTGSVPESLNHPELEIFYLQFNNISFLPPAFCSRSDPIDAFITDCGGSTPKVSCPCCSQCCPDGTKNCTALAN